METEKKSQLYLLTGLIFGLAIGLVISLMIAPAVYREASPAQLSANSRAEYRLMIAKTFESDYNLPRAQSRLALLADQSISVSLSEQIQDLQTRGDQDGVDAVEALLDALKGTANQAAPTPAQ